MGSNQLMSKEVKGPPGSPVGLCSGTGMTFRTPYAPFTVVPHVGQNGCEPQLFKRTPSANTAATSINFASLDLIEKPPPEIPLESSAPRSCFRFCEGLLGSQADCPVSNPVARMADPLRPRSGIATAVRRRSSSAA